MPIRKDPKGRTAIVGDPRHLPWSFFFEAQLCAAGFPVPVREYRAFPPRRWRFDYAWPDYKIALEIDGGVYTLGRHTRGTGYEADCRKMNAAAASGWVVFHVTPQMLGREWPETMKVLRAAFEVRRCGD